MKLKILWIGFLLLTVYQNLSAQSKPKYTVGTIERGIISYFTEPYNNRETASGEIFNKYDLVGCHKSLPFNSKVKITNLSNNKSVIVRVNDRGPYAYGRIMDVSEAVAKKIDLISTGTAKVELEVISMGNTSASNVLAKDEPEPTKESDKSKPVANNRKEGPFASGNTYTQWGSPEDPAGFTVQVGSFKDLAVAKNYCKELKVKTLINDKIYISVTEVVDKEGKVQPLYKVLVGAYDLKSQAETLKTKLMNIYVGKTFFVRVHDR
jgi:rare lipoprotein A